jgi:hypothetical protein
VLFIGAAGQVAAVKATIGANGDVVKKFGHSEKQQNGSNKNSRLASLARQISNKRRGFFLKLNF